MKRYILSFLYSFSLINSYETFNAKKLRLAECSKEGPIVGGYGVSPMGSHGAVSLSVCLSVRKKEKNVFRELVRL